MISFIQKKNLSLESIGSILAHTCETNQFTNNGPVKKLLELELQNLLNIPSDKSVFCLSNGTHALHALMYAYNLNSWVTPAFTFPSSVISGAFNVDILDINLATGAPSKAENILKQYDGIILTNLFGSYVDLKWWEDFCKNNDKVLIFDNASSPMSALNKQNICTFGDSSFGSLHHTKTLGFGEGGFVVVPSAMYDTISRISNFGFNEDRKHSIMSSNFKMSDVSAACILSHIKEYDIEKHIAVQKKLLTGIRNINGAAIFNYKEGTVYGNLPVIFEEARYVPDFDKFNIEVKKYYKPLLDLPNSLDLYSRIINFPLHGLLVPGNIDQILNCIEAMSK